MSLGKNILKLRKKNGLSQEQLGEKIKVSRQTISNWELEETSPNSEQLKLISKELNISIDELLDNDNIELKHENSNKEDSQRNLNILKTIFLVICSPIWIPLLVTLFSILLSIYILIWSLIISFWAVFGSMVAVGLYMIFWGIPFCFSNTNLTGIAMISVGMVCTGLSILLFFGCRGATKGVLLLSKKSMLSIRKYFLKARVNNE